MVRFFGRTALGLAAALSLLAIGAGASRGRSVATCRWRAIVVPNIAGADLVDVGAVSPRNVWLVGSTERWGGPPGRAREIMHTLVLHYDGRSVKRVRSPNPFRVSNQLVGVAAFGPRNVWAVGIGVTRTSPVTRYVPLVLHYDGRRWRNVSAPAPGAIESNGAELHSVAGSSAKDVWAVGMLERNDEWHGLIEHWDGRRWRIVPSPAATYSAVDVLSRKNAWATGTSGDASFASNLPTAHWNGRSWRSVKDTASRNEETYLNDVSASGGTTCGSSAISRSWSGLTEVALRA